LHILGAVVFFLDLSALIHAAFKPDASGRLLSFDQLQSGQIRKVSLNLF